MAIMNKQNKHQNFEICYCLQSNELPIIATDEDEGLDGFYIWFGSVLAWMIQVSIRNN
jgi:hypothetical protein